MYINEVKNITSDIEPVEEYVGANVPIMHHCLKHDVFWKTAPTNILSGKGCKKCKSDAISKARHKTHEQYIEELEKVNPNIICLDKYVGADTPTLHKCLIDGYEWKPRPHNLLNGRVGCPKCSQRFRRTNEDYVKEVHETYPYIVPLEEFQGMTVPILHICNKHNIKWKTSPNNILQGHGCVKCGGEKITSAFAKTTEQYIKELKKINPNIVLEEDYINSSTPILHKCLIDNYMWKVSPVSILNGTGCPKCYNHIKLTTESYKQRLVEKNSNIIPLEEYVNMNTPILHKCIKHEIEWKTSPSSVLNGGGCCICKKEKQHASLCKSHERYVNELKNINGNILPLEEYVNSLTPILHKCTIHNYNWKVAPSNLLSGHGCPKCTTSLGENKISEWLENHNVKYEYQKRFSDCKDKKTLPFDFYLPDYNTCIEYQGRQHYEPIEYFGGLEALNYRQYHDELKKEYCKNKDISLLCISFKQNIEEELDNFLFN